MNYKIGFIIIGICTELFVIYHYESHTHFFKKIKHGLEDFLK